MHCTQISKRRESRKLKFYGIHRKFRKLLKWYLRVKQSRQPVRPLNRGWKTFKKPVLRCWPLFTLRTSYIFVNIKIQTMVLGDQTGEQSSNWQEVLPKLAVFTDVYLGHQYRVPSAITDLHFQTFLSMPLNCIFHHSFSFLNGPYFLEQRWLPGSILLRFNKMHLNRNMQSLRNFLIKITKLKMYIKKFSYYETFILVTL